jgi:hypothetical protein
MAKRQKAETPKEQARRFERKVAELIAAGELNPIDADAALEDLMREVVRRPPKRLADP